MLVNFLSKAYFRFVSILDVALLNQFKFVSIYYSIREFKMKNIFVCLLLVSQLSERVENYIIL